MKSVTTQNIESLSHEASIAKTSVHRWKTLQHRRAAKCAENHKFANSKYLFRLPLLLF